MYNNNLYLITEVFTNGYSITILDILSTISIICAILVIVSKNPVISVLYLIGLFMCIASYLMLTGVTFIGLSYLLVYVGAVSILFLFILMLINIRVSELLSDTRNSIPLVIVVAISFSVALGSILSSNFNLNYSLLNKKDKIDAISTYNWDNSLMSSHHITTIGNVMYSIYSIWLIITSIILLLAMVGAIVITLKPKIQNSKNVYKEIIN